MQLGKIRGGDNIENMITKPAIQTLVPLVAAIRRKQAEPSNDTKMSKKLSNDWKGMNVEWGKLNASRFEMSH